MMRPLLFYALLLVLFFALPLPSQAASEAAFGIQVIDEATHRGVPLVVLETPDHSRYITDSAGWIALAEPGLLRRRVHFAISCPGYAFAKDATGQQAIALDLVPGSSIELSAIRADVAQRIYRVTGLGIYRDSTLLSRDVPLPRPNINAGVIAQQRVQAVQHDGQLIWAWAETQLASRAHPLLQSVGASSELPSGKGLDPSQGIHFDYFLGSEQEPATLVPCDEAGSIALDGLVSVSDAPGQPHLVAHYTRFKSDGTSIAEHGLAEYNAANHTMERLVVLGSDYAWQFPQGHAVRVSAGSTEQLYFATPLCHTRCPATYEALQNPADYEALAFDSASKSLVWQKAKPPINQREEARLIAAKSLPVSKANAQLTDIISHKPLTLSSGTVQWNAYRKRWIMLAAAALAPADTGDLWYAEATNVSGPWHRAQRIASHEGASFTQPDHHEFFDQKGGQLIYCEGSYASMKGDTPRYDGNQLMYLIDLADERLKGVAE